MNYTVKELAKISNIRVSMLHFYDEIGLLRPKSRGENGYRYYGEEQLLMLQQILFYRELGISLNEVGEILKKSDFNKIESLENHKSILLEKINHEKRLIQTINETIDYLKGKTTMNHKSLYTGFDAKKQEEYEKYLIDTGCTTAEKIKQSWENTKDWNVKDWHTLKEETDSLNKRLALAMQDQTPESDLVQSLIQEHYKIISKFWVPDRAGYIGLADLYLEHDDFGKFYEAYSPGLVEFVSKSMKIYAQKLPI